MIGSMPEPIYERPEKRTTRDTRQERDLGYGRLKDYHTASNRVEMFWDFNEEAAQDHIVKLRINNLKVGPVEVYLDAEQMRQYLRWV